jgi:hypothetical protein
MIRITDYSTEFNKFVVFLTVYLLDNITIKINIHKIEHQSNIRIFI